MAKKGEKIIKEATAEEEKLLMSVRKNLKDPVVVRNKTYYVGWTHPFTEDRITQLMLKDGNDSKILAQCAALLVLGDYWKTFFFYWIVWRWFYYIKQYNAKELTPIFEMGQKKTAQEEAPAYLNATILLTVFKDTKKMMTKAEAERILHARNTDNDGK